MRYDTNTIPALVLAGGINRIVLYEGYKPGHKGLLPFRGKPLLQYTLDALQKTPRISRIGIVGPVRDIMAAIQEPERYEYAESGATLIENIAKGLNHFNASPVVLVIPSDLPLVRSETISRFLALCSALNTVRAFSIFWSVVPEERFSGSYLSVKKGFNRFRDISLCHGNLLLLTPFLLKNKKFMARMDGIYNSRKSSVKAAVAVGPLIGLSYLIGVHTFRILTLAQFARLASAGFGVDLVPVVIEDPDIAVDVDEARDYRFIMEELVRREHNGKTNRITDRIDKRAA